MFRQPVSSRRTVGDFAISEQGIKGWESPFSSEEISPEKKKEIAKAVRARR
jgi:hypothetical protein